jgi:hypothetical protein
LFPNDDNTRITKVSWTIQQKFTINRFFKKITDQQSVNSSDQKKIKIILQLTTFGRQSQQILTSTRYNFILSRQRMTITKMKQSHRKWKSTGISSKVYNTAMEVHVIMGMQCALVRTKENKTKPPKMEVNYLNKSYSHHWALTHQSI